VYDTSGVDSVSLAVVSLNNIYDGKSEANITSGVLRFRCVGVLGVAKWADLPFP
jgi:hypothetical protein